MKGTLFSADFVKDGSGNPRLLEINTDTTLIESIIDSVADFTAFNSVLSSNNITEVHVVFKGFHKPLVSAISASVAANVGSVTTWSETEEEHTTVYPTSVADAADKFILRLAYDENAIFDSTYAKVDFNLYKLYNDNSDNASTIGVYHSSSLGELDTLANDLNAANIPDVAVRPVSTTKLGLGWFKIGSSSMDSSERVSNFKNIIGSTSNIICNYYRSGSASKVSALRSFQVIYGDDLAICNLAQYEIDALLDIPAADISIDDSLFANKVSKKHYFEYATNDISDDDGIFTEERVNLEAGGSHLASAAVVGSEYDSYFVSGSPDTDSNVALGQWSIAGPNLPDGSFSTSSILQGAVSQSIKSNSIRKLTLNDGSILRVGGGNRILTLNTASNEISYMTARDVISGYDIFDSAGNKKSITGTEVEILSNESDAYTIQLSVEDVDNYIVSGSNLILHNAPCFVAGTEISYFKGEDHDGWDSNKPEDWDLIHQRPIEEIEVGDHVLSYNHDDKVWKPEVKEVLQVMKKENEEIIKIEFDNGFSLKCTPDHPIFTKQGYASYDPDATKEQSDIHVDKLDVGSECQTLPHGELKENGELPEHIKVTSISVEKAETVYNLKEVADNHNFYANKILVHNRWGIFACFGKGSQVQMFDGSTKAIEEVKVGDEVKTKTGEKGIVKDALIHPVNDMIPVYKYNNTEVEGNHPIFIDGEWKAAKDYIDTSEWKFVNEFYNLEVEGGEHTYIVEDLIASGLGDNKELNEKYQRQPKQLINNL